MELTKKTIDLGSGVSLDLVYIPGGTFLMGSDQKSTEQPVHQVTVRSFWMGKTPVTQEQWVEVMGDNPSYFKGSAKPVEQVNWHQAKEFCERVSKNTGHQVRLPTEAEWEYAARGGTTDEYSFGDDRRKLVEYAWFDVNSEGQTHPVGQKKPNPFGLYDMHGNVWEWVEDHWYDDYKGAPTDGSAWLTGGNSALRVLRGGSWYFIDLILRSANRDSDFPAYRLNDFGFRVVVGAQTQSGK
jgi:formylglycine-generating enzyme required for sulfatase activity